MNKNIDKNRLPVMMYLHGFMSGANGAKQCQLQQMFKGRYRVIAPELTADIEYSTKVINELMKSENPEIVVGTSLGGFMAMVTQRQDVDVVVVNPVTDPCRQLAHWLDQERTYFCKRLDGVQTYTLTKDVLDKYKDYGFEYVPALTREWDCGHLSALCSTNDELLGDSHIKVLQKYINPEFMMVVDDFGHQCRDAGLVHLKELLEKVIARRELIKQSTMSFELYKEMVHNRPIPDTSGYYHLDVYAFSHGINYNENVENRYIPDDKPIEFERHIDQGNVNFRASVNCATNGEEPLNADFATREEAEAAIREIAGKESLVGFTISRYGFGQLAHHRFPVEQWMYDVNGEFVQKSSCSAFHYMKPGMDGKFFGHENLPYKVGDKVMILHRYVGDYRMYAVPGIIVSEPDDLSDGYESYKGNLENWIRKGNAPETWADEIQYPGSDEDEYFVQFGSYDPSWIHLSFQHPLSIFPLPFPLPKEIDAELNEWYHEYKVRNQEL